jgi:hypothetical protein
MPFECWATKATNKRADLFFFRGKIAPVCQGLLSIEASRSNSNTTHSVGFLWKSDQSFAETSTWHNTTVTRGRLLCPRQDSNSHHSKWRPQTHGLYRAANGIDTPSEYLTLTAFPRQKWLCESAAILHFKVHCVMHLLHWSTTRYVETWKGGKRIAAWRMGLLSKVVDVSRIRR